jgi:hypothetical protein
MVLNKLQEQLQTQMQSQLQKVWKYVPEKYQGYIPERLRGMPAFDDLAEMPLDSEVPRLDRTFVDESKLTPEQLAWRRDGLVILPKAIPDKIINAYCKTREGRLPHTLGFPTSYAYLSVPQIRDICLHGPVGRVMESLLGVKMAVHFDLTQWISTERQWHQDDYLNPPEINSWYMAVWFALDDIAADSGPFQYAPGSHRWPVIRGHKVRAIMRPEEANSPQWPGFSEKIVTPVYEKKLADSGLPTKYFLAKKGDVLIWHGRLLHRGTVPTNPNAVRKSLITHFTAVNKITPSLHELAYHKDGFPYIVHKDVVPFEW